MTRQKRATLVGFSVIAIIVGSVAALPSVLESKLENRLQTLRAEASRRRSALATKAFVRPAVRQPGRDCDAGSSVRSELNRLGVYPYPSSDDFRRYESEYATLLDRAKHCDHTSGNINDLAHLGRYLAWQNQDQCAASAPIILRLTLDELWPLHPRSPAFHVLVTTVRCFERGMRSETLLDELVEVSRHHPPTSDTVDFQRLAFVLQESTTMTMQLPIELQFSHDSWTHYREMDRDLRNWESALTSSVAASEDRQAIAAINAALVLLATLQESPLDPRLVDSRGRAFSVQRDQGTIVVAGATVRLAFTPGDGNCPLGVYQLQSPPGDECGSFVLEYDER